MFSEILEYSQQSYLALWSALMIIIGIITIISLITGFDGDLDIGGDVDVDADLDGHVDAHGIFHTFYIFMNVGKTPITLVIFSFVIVNWALCMIANTTFNSAHNVLIGWGIFVAALFASIPVVKVIVIPLRMFFGALLEDEEKQTHSIGNICTTSTEVTSTNGQASIKEGPTIVNLMVICEEGKTISKGKQAIVLSKDKKRNRYLISEIEENIFN